MLEQETRERIDNFVNSHHVALFMKGSKTFPQCGFSGQVVQVLSGYGVPFETCDVLSNPEIRQGLKEYSDWPTFPQLYIDGQFIGGCDIVTELHQSGQLKKMLEN